MRVLVVDDNPVNRELSKEQIVACGHEAWVSDGSNGLLLALELKDFDLVLMDLDMPGMDGFECARAIRALEVGTARRVPVVATTACLDYPYEQMCIRAGMDGFLTKPLRLNELAQALKHLCKPGKLAACA